MPVDAFLKHEERCGSSFSSESGCCGVSLYCVCVCFNCKHSYVFYIHFKSVCVCWGGAGSPVSSATILCLISFQHDDSVASLGRAIGIFNNLQPPYLASIILELHEQDGNFFVKTLFENHTSDSPYTKTIKGLS